MKYTDILIGCCGLDCEKCDARIATLANDNALRKKTAALWTELNGVTILPEMINCVGCRVEGEKTPFCDKLCHTKACIVSVQYPWQWPEGSSRARKPPKRL